MNRRQMKKRYKLLCRKYGSRISETYTDGRMTKVETRRVRQSLNNINTILKIKNFAIRECAKHVFKPEPFEYTPYPASPNRQLPAEYKEEAYHRHPMAYLMPRVLEIDPKINSESHCIEVVNICKGDKLVRSINIRPLFKQEENDAT